MTEPSPPSTAKQLRVLRDEFAASAKKTLADLDKAIWEAELAEIEREKQALRDRFVPGNDAAVLAGHDIVFLIAKTKNMGGGLDSPLGAAVDTAYQLQVALKNIADVTVAAKLWGQGATSGIFLGSYESVKNAFSGTESEARQFLPVAKEILAANLPDKAAGRKTHYVIICDGTITDDVAASASVLAAAVQFNPKITFDAVICGAEPGNIAGVLPAGREPLVVAATGAEVADAVFKTLKSVLAAEKPVAPVAKPADAAPKL